MGLKRRHDPLRRERILEITLDMIAEFGIAGTTHRKVAAAADVPLSSMTYYFTGLEDLFVEAFRLYSQSVLDRYTEALDAANSKEEMREAFVRLLCGDLAPTKRDMALDFELNAYSSRMAGLREIQLSWLDRCEEYFSRFYDTTTASALVMLMDGMAIYRDARHQQIAEQQVRLILDRLIPMDGSA